MMRGTDRNRGRIGVGGPARDDRGVSEVVAFVLVFAIIIGSVGLLYSTGFQAMNDYQQTEQMRNAERAMSSLSDNFNDVLRYNGVNQRYGELSLREGTVSTAENGTQLNITVDGVNGDEPLGTNGETHFADYGTNTTVDLGAFTYTAERERIAYEGGAVVRADDSETWSVVLNRPHVRCDDRNTAATISLVSISADDRSLMSTEGQGFTMTVENRSSRVYEASEVTIAVEETVYDDAWASTFDDGGDWDWDDSNAEATCDHGDLERVVVTLVEVDLEY